MKRLALFFLVSLFVNALVPAAFAQDATPVAFDPEIRQQHDPPGSIIHATDLINNRPEVRAALRQFHEDRAAGLIPPAKLSGLDDQVGDRATFKVLIDVLTNLHYEDQEFELRATNEIVNIWVQLDEWMAARVTQDDVDEIFTNMVDATPATSISPEQGIMEIEHEYIGDPPNVDGDGKVDILLYDIIEGEDTGGSFIGGLVYSNDLLTNGSGNRKDVLYLDTNPGIASRPIETALSTAAHEYQHLLRFNYDWNEITFVDEGMSEWVELLIGYSPRSMSYLQNFADYNLRLTSWDRGSSVLNDYQRAGLFTQYMSEQIGPVSTGSIARLTFIGIPGYESVLGDLGLELEDIMADFHAANWLNNTSLDPAFGYEHDELGTVGAAPSREVDGKAILETSPTTVSVASGGVAYLTWSDVKDFTLTMDTADEFDHIRARVKVRAVLVKDGVTSISDVTLPSLLNTYTGNYDSITLIVSHVQPALSSAEVINYEANWKEKTSGSQTVALQYDDGEVIAGIPNQFGGFFSMSAGADGKIATKFTVPTDGVATLDEVDIAPYFFSQFNQFGLPQSAPRDVVFHVWEVAPSGEPGSSLFSVDVTDPRPYAGATKTLDFFTVDLTSYSDQLNNLPAEIYIGLTEAGADENFMIVGPSDLSGEESVSMISTSAGGWQDLWDVQFQGLEGQFPLQGAVIPIRPLFLIDVVTSDESPFEVATEAALLPNYPNPFSSATTISYTIPSSGPVRINVYDTLGREITTLVDAVQGPGNHQVAFSANGLPGGLYFYAFEYDGRRQSRPMMVVR